jgi:hypothetical protein
MLALSIFSAILVVPVNAAIVQGPAAPPPAWVTVNSTASGNYPGGNEQFTVFVVNTEQKPTINETIQNMTLTAPFASNFGAGLPATIAPGHSLLLTIYLQIPVNFSQPSFTADLVAYITVLNSTVTTLKVTGNAPVNVFGLTSQTTTQTTAPPSSQSGSISTTLFAAGVGIPSVIAVVLVALLVRARATKRVGA